RGGGGAGGGAAAARAPLGRGRRPGRGAVPARRRARELGPGGAGGGVKFLTFLGRRWGRDPSSGGPRTVRACTDSGRRTSERGASVVSPARSPAAPGGSARRPVA